MLRSFVTISSDDTRAYGCTSIPLDEHIGNWSQLWPSTNSSVSKNEMAGYIECVENQTSVFTPLPIGMNRYSLKEASLKCENGFRSPRTIADILTMITNRISEVFTNKYISSRFSLDISKAFDKAWHKGLLQWFVGKSCLSDTIGVWMVMYNERRQAGPSREGL